MTQARAGAACVALPDGRVLVTGGTDGNATLASAEVYDSATDAWHSIGNMSVGRVGHTATATSAGAVLLVGGENTGVVELFTNDTFLSAGTLATSRSGYAVAATIGHKVVIAGGSDGRDSALAAIEIYDGETGKLIPGGTMLAARRNFAAAPLIDGTLLLSGGYGADGAMLASSEIFDPERGTSVAGPTMSAARANHKSTVLPSNGRILLVGGIDQNGVTAGSEIYTPWTRQFDSAPPMHTARQQMVITPLRRGALVVAGGKGPAGTLADSEVYAFATLDTDKSDYAPGEQATFSGIGWNAGEQVLIQVSALPLDRHSVEFTATATADSTGRISIAPFNIDLSHLGKRFLATASGSRSQAQNVFGAAFTSTVTTTVSPLTQTVGQVVEFTSCVATVSGITPTGTIIFKIGSPISAAIPLVGGCATLQYSQLNGGNSIVGVTYSGDANYSFNIPPSGNLNLTVAKAATTSTVTSNPPGPLVSGTSVQLIGTVTSTATAVNGFQIGGASNATFQDNGVNIPGCVLLTVNNGSVTCNLGIPTLGSHSFVLNFLNTDPNFLPSTSAPNVVAVQRTATAGALITIPASPIVYNTAATVRAQFGPSGGGPALTGTVSFFDGLTLLGTAVVVSGGNTDFALPNSVIQSVGNHSLTARYDGDATYFATVAPFPATTLVVNKAPTNLSAPVLTGGTALSATVTPASGGGVPTGTIIFTIDAVAQSPVAINASGTGTMTVSLAPGNRSFSAAYSGDSSFLVSSSGPVNLTVPGGTATAGALSTIPASPIAYGTSTTARAQFGPSGGGPALTGTVSFFDGVTLLGTVAVVSGGNTDFALPISVIQGAGNHNFTARYSGDTNYLGSVAPFPATTLVVNKVPTNTSAPLLTAGTLSATVTPASGGGVPTGTVIFTIDGAAQSAVAINASGTGSLTVSLAAGSHTFSAAYSGDAIFLPSSSGNSSQSVSAPAGLSNATLLITSSPTFPVAGQPVTVTVSVISPGPVPTGTVQFFEGATLLGTVQLINGQAALTITFPVGSHTLVIKYLGDGSTREASASFSVVVARLPLLLTLTSNLSASVYGQMVTLTAKLTAQSPTTVALPSGPIQFLEGSTVVATGIISQGTAVVSISSLDVGLHSIRAAFPGDANWFGATSTAVTVLVSKAQPVLTLTALPDVTGAPQVTVTSTISVVAPGGWIPAGAVQFVDTATNTVLGTAQIVGTTATATLNEPSASSRTIAAIYSGTSNYLSGRSPDVTHISITNAASFAAFHASPDEIMTIFGANLASASDSASALPLPVKLAGTTVKITDQAGVDYQAPLYFASPAQINLLIPPNVPLGPVRITVLPADGSSFAILTAATNTTPGLFTANSNGRGIAAAQVIRVSSTGSQSIENVAKLDPAQQTFVAAPISFGSDRLFLALYGTGIRHAQSSSTVTCTVNGQKLPVLFAGAHSIFVGLDQINVQLPGSLAGAGQVTVVVEVDGQASNSVNLVFQ